MSSRSLLCLLAIAAAVSVLGVPPPSEFKALFEKNTGFKIDFTRDLACIAASYDSQYKAGISAYGCAKFRVRWKPVEAIKGVNSLKNGEYIAGPHNWFGSDGLHMKVHESSYLDLFGAMSERLVKDVQPIVVAVSFRHQESMSYFNEEMHEAMSLYGRAATVDRKEGGKPNLGAAITAGLIRVTRSMLGMSYFPHAQRMFAAVQAHYAASKQPVQYVLTGFSLGGVYASMLAVHSGGAVPAITFASCGVEDALLEAYPPPAASGYTPIRANSSVVTPYVYNLFHDWDNTPQLDCQIGYVCAWQRRTRVSNATDSDGDGKVDAAHKHEEEVPRDRDGDGDIDPDDSLPTAEEAEQKHLELIFGVTGDDDHAPDFFRFLDSPDMVPLCSGGGAYSHVYGSCTREAGEWEERKRYFHRWRKQYIRSETMGRKHAAAKPGDADDDAVHGLHSDHDGDDGDDDAADGGGDGDSDGDGIPDSEDDDFTSGRNNRRHDRHDDDEL